MRKLETLVIPCLAGVVVCLLLVGLVSGTFVRHVVQVLAPVVALVALWRGYTWAGYAALPLFTFWLLIMSLIWLYLLGLSNFASGTYSPIEQVLTAAIAIFCLAGMFALFRRAGHAHPLAALGAFVGFGVLQFVVMWLSFLPVIQHR